MSKDRDSLIMIAILVLLLPLIIYVGVAWFAYPCEAFNKGYLGTWDKLPARCVAKEAK